MSNIRKTRAKADPAFQVNLDTDPDTNPIRIQGFDDQ